MTWIACKDAMPDELKKVLTREVSGKMEVLWLHPAWEIKYKYEARWHGTGADNIANVVSLRRITHWMPLPAPPCVDSHNEPEVCK